MQKTVTLLPCIHSSQSLDKRALAVLFITFSPALLALSIHGHLPEPVFILIRGKLSAIIIYLMLEHGKRFHLFFIFPQHGLTDEAFKRQ